MAKLKDVAQEANVSISSVSNVIRGIPTVSESVRDAVKQAIKRLKYVPKREVQRRAKGAIGRITLKDVAKKAGVSVSTVSCVIRNEPNISAKVKENVTKVINSIGYIPSTLARGMVGSNTHKIAFFFPGFHDFQTFNNSNLVKGLGDTLHESDYSLNFIPIKKKDVCLNIIETVRNHYISARPDALVFLDVVFTDEILDELSQLPCPWVLMNMQSTHRSASYVALNEEDGAYQAARHLIELGHRRIAIQGPLDCVYFGTYRLAGFKRALQEAGLPTNYQFCTSSFACPQEEIKPIIAQIKSSGITGLYCLSDLLAGESILSAQELKMVVPQDLSIVGCNDNISTHFLRPQLTTIISPGLEIGNITARLLLDWVNRPSTRPQHVILPAKLVVRESTCPPLKRDRVP